MKDWNQQTLGERIVTAAWMAVREHLAQEQRRLLTLDADEITGPDPRMVTRDEGARGPMPVRRLRGGLR